MTEKKGMVLEIRHRNCIVLTPDGDFVKVPLSGNRQVLLGQEITFNPVRPKRMMLKPFLVAASIVLFLVAAQIYQGVTPPASAAAYISLDINPSIELAVGDKNLVIAVQALNTGGEKLLQQVNVLDLDVYQGIQLLVSNAIKAHYMQPGQDNVVLTTFTVSGGKNSPVQQEQIYRAINKPLQDGNLQADVVIEPVKSELRAEAKKAGLSTGRYLLYQEIKKKGVSISVEELKNYGMNKLETEKGLKIEDLIPGKGNQTTLKHIDVKITLSPQRKSQAENNAVYSGHVNQTNSRQYPVKAQPHPGLDQSIVKVQKDSKPDIDQEDPEDGDKGKAQAWVKQKNNRSEAKQEKQEEFKERQDHKDHKEHKEKEQDD